jgi:hypothetical protein
LLLDSPRSIGKQHTIYSDPGRLNTSLAFENIDAYYLPFFTSSSQPRPRAPPVAREAAGQGIQHVLVAKRYLVKETSEHIETGIFLGWKKSNPYHNVKYYLHAVHCYIFDLVVPHF